MARPREDQVQAIEKYGTHLFYGAGPEQHNQRGTSNFGATYSNGQARPVAPVLPINRPVAKVEPINRGSNATNVRNENWRRDQIVFSSETTDLRNGSAWSTGSAPSTSNFSAGRGDTSGPAYSADFRRTLDALLNGSASVV